MYKLRVSTIVRHRIISKLDRDENESCDMMDDGYVSINGSQKYYMALKRECLTCNMYLHPLKLSNQCLHRQMRYIKNKNKFKKIKIHGYLPHNFFSNQHCLAILNRNTFPPLNNTEYRQRAHLKTQNSIILTTFKIQWQKVSQSLSRSPFQHALSGTPPDCYGVPHMVPKMATAPRIFLSPQKSKK